MCALSLSLSLSLPLSVWDISKNAIILCRTANMLTSSSFWNVLTTLYHSIIRHRRWCPFLFISSGYSFFYSCNLQATWTFNLSELTQVPKALVSGGESLDMAHNRWTNSLTDSYQRQNEGILTVFRCCSAYVLPGNKTSPVAKPIRITFVVAGLWFWGLTGLRESVLTVSDNGWGWGPFKNTFIL